MPEIYSYEEFPQGSAEWFELRAGLPTASNFSAVMAKPGPRGGRALTREKYLRELAGEIITGEVAEPEWKGNRHTERGKEREDEARALYEVRGVKVRQVGFVRNGNCGCSPDGLIDDDGGLEIKDAIPSVQIARLQDGALPSEYRWQLVGSLLVTEREWWDFMSYSRGLPSLEIRVYRDKVRDELDELRAGIDRFNAELDLLVRQIGAMW